MQINLNDNLKNALRWYNDEMGFHMDTVNVIGSKNEYAEELIYCWMNKKTVDEFDRWTQYEYLLGEGVSFSEFKAIDQKFQRDILSVSEDDALVIDFLRMIKKQL